ncbi:MAG: hypothetical protein IJ455_00870 [Agathobacter sp.]|nr:hypothetical protein [Agathobacter sp.]
MSDSVYWNSGTLFRRLFPKPLKSQVSIFIWVAVFFINIVLVVLVQNFLIYRISDKDLSYENLGNTAYFKDCDIVGINNAGHNDYYVKYINEDNEKRIVCLDGFPVDIIKRFHVMKSTDMAVADDGMVLYQKGTNEEKISEEKYLEKANPGSPFDIIWQAGVGNHIQRLAMVYVVIGVGMLLIEFFFYSIFHRLFRE